MRILHVITGLAAGGAEQQVRLLLRHRTHPAEVAALTNPGSVARAIRAEGTVVHEVGMRGNTDMGVLPRLTGIIRDGHFDVVHTHLFRAQLYGRLAARLAGVRHIVSTEHSLGAHAIEGRPVSRSIRTAYRAAERLGEVTIAVSDTVARRLRDWGVPGSRVQTIPNGIEMSGHRFDPRRRVLLRHRFGFPEERFVVGTVGRLVPGKRIELILRAVSGLPGITVLVAGDGPGRAALERTARALRVDAVFTGESPDVPGLMSIMDVLVSASEEETFGLAVVEGLAAGLPVLYTAAPALDDMPADSLPGATRFPADPRALRAALTEVARAGPGRLPAPPALERFDITRLTPRVESVYERITGTRVPLEQLNPTHQE
jgi:glycosyltransferase involved in cell wall biosynthesis